MASDTAEPAVLTETIYKCVKCGRTYENEEKAFECFKTHAKAIDVLPDRKQEDRWYFGGSRNATLPGSVIVKFEHENDDIFARYTFARLVDGEEVI